MRMLTHKKVYDVYDYTIPGSKGIYQVIVPDHRCYGRFISTQGSINHRLSFDKFDEECLKYIIKRSNAIDVNLVTHGRIHHDYVFKESHRTHCRFVAEVEITHDESGEKMWMPIAYLPTFGYELIDIDTDDERWEDFYTYNHYKEFCENNKNWEWVSEYTPAPKFIEVKEYGSQEPKKGRRKK